MFLFVITNKRTAPSRGFQRHVCIEDGEQEKHLGAYPGSVLPKAFVICLLLKYSLHLCFYLDGTEIKFVLKILKS